MTKNQPLIELTFSGENLTKYVQITTVTLAAITADIILQLLIDVV